MAGRFEEGRTATLYRVYVLPEHRRQGLATALVRSCLDFIASRDRYTGVYLHTDARTPGAVEFWERHGKVIFDERVAVNEQRTESLGEAFETVHFALELPADGEVEGPGRSERLSRSRERPGPFVPRGRPGGRAARGVQSGIIACGAPTAPCRGSR
ncbi:hypothetical protein GCM10029992_27070 [Glycomyces albus]